MRDDSRTSRILRFISGFLAFFLCVAFAITCCIMLFVTVLTSSLGIELTAENVGPAAKLTLLNTVLISLIFTVIDTIRRKFTVERPIRRIVEAAERMIDGDFSVRIPHTGTTFGNNELERVVDCFNRMAEELSSTETLRTDFVANVSHELKTPLAVMRNYATMLRTPALSEEKRAEYAKAIEDASARLADLISNILKLNKLENQQITPSPLVYDLGEQICECMLNFEQVIEDKELILDVDIEDGLLVRADSEMMSLVWNNLFSNAVKFTGKGGRIGLCVKADGDHAYVSVSDTGPGISREVGARIFDKFYQGDISHATEGNGLGLSLVKRVVDLTGSTVSVQSELGVGSTFTVTMERYLPKE